MAAASLSEDRLISLLLTDGNVEEDAGQLLRNIVVVGLVLKAISSWNLLHTVAEERKTESDLALLSCFRVSQKAVLGKNCFCCCPYSTA